MLVLDLGVGHGGNLARAKEMVDAALNCGVSAVKVQCYAPNLWAGNRVPANVPRSLSAREVAELIEHCNKLNIPMGATLFTISDFHNKQWYTQGLSYVKLACDEYKQDTLRKRADAVAARLPGVQCSCGHLHKIMASATNPNDFALRRVRGAHLLCVPCYPCPTRDVPMCYLRAPRAKPLGYSDHTGNLDLVKAAFEATDCVVEVHHDSEGKWGHSWQALKALVKAREAVLGRAKRVEYLAVGRNRNLQREVQG